MGVLLLQTWESGTAGTELVRADPGVTRGQAVAESQVQRLQL